MEAPQVEMCPDCGVNPARPKAKGRRCHSCYNRHRYAYDDAWRERHLDRERDRQRVKSAQRRAAAPKFFEPPAA